MENELAVLENKINALAQLCRRLRLDNHNLRQSLSDQKHECEALEAKVEKTAHRIEHLLDTLPEDAR